jgi:PPOX class probable F420-dependent enzyme
MSAVAPASIVELPTSHLDLLERPIPGVLTTLLRDGSPHSCLVWVDHDGHHARVNTTLQRCSGKDLARDPRASLLVVDPEDTARFIQIRGEVELVTQGAVEHLDTLTRRYTRHPRFYGFVYPAEQEARELRVIAVIHAHHARRDPRLTGADRGPDGRPGHRSARARPLVPPSGRWIVG